MNFKGSAHVIMEVGKAKILSLETQENIYIASWKKTPSSSSQSQFFKTFNWLNKAHPHSQG